MGIEAPHVVTDLIRSMILELDAFPLAVGATLAHAMASDSVPREQAGAGQVLTQSRWE